MCLRLRGNKEEQEGVLGKKKIDQGEATLLGKRNYSSAEIWKELVYKIRISFPGGSQMRGKTKLWKIKLLNFKTPMMRPLSLLCNIH